MISKASPLFFLVAAFCVADVAGQYCSCKGMWTQGGTCSTQYGCPVTACATSPAGYSDGYSWCEVDASTTSSCTGATQDWSTGLWYMSCDASDNGRYPYGFYNDDDDWYTTTPSSTCDWDTNWYPIIVLGSIVGALLTGIPSTILGSLPCCCGACLEKKKVLAYIGLILGIISLFIPLVSSIIATQMAIDAHCSDTDCQPNGCTEDEEQAGRDVLNALGVLVAYTVGHGYIALMTGVAGIITSACTLCDCCKAKGDATPATGAPGVTVTAVVQATKA